MTTLHVMRGYPGSGKSTIALQIASEGAMRVCRDDLRMMLLGSYWTGKRDDERRVTIAEKAIVHSFLKKGIDVVVDATHLSPIAMQSWASVAERNRVDFIVHDVPLSPDLCMLRDKLRGDAGERSVGKDVILRMALQFPIKDWVAYPSSVCHT